MHFGRADFGTSMCSAATERVFILPMDDSGRGPGDDQDPQSVQGTPGRDARPALRTEATATEHNAAELRRRFHDWLALDTAVGIVDDLVLVVYEAVANAVEHAYAGHTDGPGPVRLEAHRADGHVLITVTDAGTWRAPTGDRFRGRGLTLMRHLAQEVTVESDYNGTVVHVRAVSAANPL